MPKLTEADLVQILRVAERADWPSEVFALVRDLRTARAARDECLKLAEARKELLQLVRDERDQLSLERDRLLVQLRQAGSGPADAVVVAAGG